MGFWEFFWLMIYFFFLFNFLFFPLFDFSFWLHCFANSGLFFHIHRLCFSLLNGIFLFYFGS